MSWQTEVCGKCLTPHEFYGRHVPPCPKCGYPEVKTTEEYLKSIGVSPKEGEVKCVCTYTA